MDTVVIQNLVIMMGILALLIWTWLINSRFEEEKAELFDQLEVLDRGMNIIGAFLQKIPEMQPQFSINQNPLGQFLEFFQSLREERMGNEPAGGILEDTAVRDDAGRFSDGTEEQKENEQA